MFSISCGIMSALFSPCSTFFPRASVVQYMQY